MDELKSHSKACREPHVTCFACQLHKLANGLLSGEYAKPVSDEHKFQRGIPPIMFKHLIGRDHPEFSTFRQQDAFEFVAHFLATVEKQERAGGNDPSKAFSFQLESRLQCLGCQGVRYKDLKESCMNLFMAADATFRDCLQHYFADSLGEDYNCPVCQTKTAIKTTLRVKSFPEVLVVVLKRFIVGSDYVMKKLSVFFSF